MSAQFQISRPAFGCRTLLVFKGCGFRFNPTVLTATTTHDPPCYLHPHALKNRPDRPTRPPPPHRPTPDTRKESHEAAGVGLAPPQVGLPLQLAVIEDREDYLTAIPPAELL